MTPDYPYQKVAVGGTFDRLHRGHRHILEQAFALGEEVVIGVTSDEFIANKELVGLIQPYNQRIEQLEYWLGEHNCFGRYQIVTLKDIYGTTIEDTTLQAIVVTQESLAGAEAINNERLTKDLEPLVIVAIDLLDDASNVTLSSTRIRSGKVSSEGEVYAQIFSSDLRLLANDLLQLKEPMGQLFSQSELLEYLPSLSPTKIAVVGDQTLKFFLDNDLNFNYAAFDGKTQRTQPIHFDLPDLEIILVDNPSGMVAHEAVDGIRRLMLSEEALLKVTGEEDLLTLVFVLLLPLGSLVLYGQPDEGIVMVEVNEIAKDRWYHFLKQAVKIIS